MEYFIAYLILALIWPVAVWSFDKWVKPPFRSLRAKAKKASSSQIKEAVRNFGIAIAASGFFGAFFGITADTKTVEIVVRTVLAVIFAVVGTLVVILGLESK